MENPNTIGNILTDHGVKNMKLTVRSSDLYTEGRGKSSVLGNVLHIIVESTRGLYRLKYMVTSVALS